MHQASHQVSSSGNCQLRQCEGLRPARHGHALGRRPSHRTLVPANSAMFIDSSTVDTVRVVSQVLTTGALAAGAWLFLRDSNLQVREEERQMKHSGCSPGFRLALFTSLPRVGPTRLNLAYATPSGTHPETFPTPSLNRNRTMPPAALRPARAATARATSHAHAPAGVKATRAAATHAARPATCRAGHAGEAAPRFR